MSVKILFFAKLRDQVGVDSWDCLLPSNEARNELTAKTLLTYLPAPMSNLAHLADHDIRCAINQTMAKLTDVVHDGDEVAYFPPVTGG